MAVLDHDGGIPYTFAALQIKLGLESTNLASRISAISAILMLIEANSTNVSNSSSPLPQLNFQFFQTIGPLLPTLFKHIIEELSGTNATSGAAGSSLRLLVHLLALTFLLIEHFPKESEEMVIPK